MSDAKSKVTGSSSKDVAGNKAPRSSPSVSDDHLATIRLESPGIAPLAPASSFPSTPASGAQSPGAASLPPVPRPPAARGSIAPPPQPSSAPAALARNVPAAADSELSRPKANWLASLIEPALPPVSTGVERLSQRRFGVACLVAAVVLVVVALVLGLSAPPAESVLSPAVVGAVVIARAIMALGILATGLTFLRIGVRLLHKGLSRQPSSTEGR